MVSLVAMLTALAAAAAGGMRLSSPLLILVLLSQQLNVCPESQLLAWLCQPGAIVILAFWTLFELIGSRTPLGQRLLQSVQLVLAPVVAAVLIALILPESNWLYVTSGAALAAILQLVQMGYVFRKGFLPLWFTLTQDLLAMALVFMALGAPLLGGLVALGMVGLALHQAQQWRADFAPACGKS